ncbi:hypothetical protein [Lentzea kentuckyensis]|uniref:hypothetical protein n=1 Tax=Lentzea kentuckyensis TaxID=360086 RepID=UPI00117A5350|nr:hypothetical protein [Lentzea kentuckyensis]
MQPEHQASPSSRFDQPRRAAADFAQARLDAETAGVHQQRQAARRVAERSHDVGDCRELLAMLGLANLPALAADGAGRL